MDEILGWLVIFTPFALSVIFIFIPSQTEDRPTNRRWRIALVVTMLLFGVLAWYQQTSAAKSAARERDNAITQTSTKVSAAVTKSVTEEYLPVVAEFQQKLLDLEVKIDAAKGNPKLMAALQAQVSGTLRQGNILNQQLLLVRLSEDIDKLQIAFDKWKVDDAAARGKAGPKGRYDPVYMQQKELLCEQYAASLQPTVADARYVREQLRVALPAQVGISEMGDDTRLGRASTGRPYGELLDLGSIIADLTLVRRKASIFLAPKPPSESEE